MRHFLSGRPADLYDDTNPDWLPTLNLGHGKKESASSMATTERWERKKARTEATARREKEQTLLSTDTPLHSVATHSDVAECHPGDEEVSQIASGVVEAATKTELTSGAITTLEGELDRFRHTVDELTIACRQRVLPLTEESLQTDESVIFYTGLPNFKTLKAVFDHIVQSMPCSENTKLTPFQEFMAVMLKLRLNCQLQDLAYRLSVSLSTISRILLKWLTVMDDRLRRLILWPDREDL